MAFYETVYIARQDLSAAQNEELAKQFTKIVNDNGGKVERSEFWGLRQLAYKIKKNKKGHYVLFHISGEPGSVKELERNLYLNEDVLRYLTVKMDELPKGPTIMMQDNEEGSSAGGRAPSGRTRRPRRSETNESGEE